MSFTICGVHELHVSEPCYLIEAELSDSENFDWGKVTQEVPDLPQSNWQVPWDERPLYKDKQRWVFFFHYLDLTKPLLTPYGSIPLPLPTPLPEHLTSIEYESPS